VRANFSRLEDSDEVVGSGVWTGHGVEIRADRDEVRQAIRRVFRSIPLAVDDPSLRSFGTSGPVLLTPGTLRWFAAAARSRAAGEGFRVRLVPGGGNAMGWDPAGAYRTFLAAVERKERIGSPERRGAPEAGEVRPEAERGPSAPGTEAAKPAPGPSAASPSKG
jgi:hypothetical protein